MEKNVVVTVFKVESEGYQALTELKQAAEGENHFVTAAALVKKEGNTTPTILRRWTVSDMKRMHLYPDVFKPGILTVQHRS